MRSQKKATRAMRADWPRAVVEGRVLRLSPTSMKSYPTIEARDAALAEAKAAGLNVVIVQAKENVS